LGELLVTVAVALWMAPPVFVSVARYVNSVIVSVMRRWLMS
jgi:hypothetical protein